MMRDEKAMFALMLIVVCILAGSAGQIFWKQGMAGMGKISNISDLLQAKVVWKIFTNTYIIFGLILYAIAVFLWLGAMSSLDVSYMYPLLSLGYVLTAILSFILIGENITLLRWAGIVLIIVGCFFITKS